MTPARAELDRPLADLLLKERTIPVVAHLVALGLVLVLVWGTLPMGVFIPWAGAVISLVGARTVLWGRARTSGASPAAVALTARVTMSFLGLAWGIGMALAAQYLPTATLAMVLLALAGLMSAAIATLAADRWTFPLYSAAMFGPAIVGMSLVIQGRVEGAAIALMVVFVAFTLRLHRHAHEMLVEQLQTEAILRRRERQLAAAQAIAHVGSWELDSATNRVTWSAEAYRLYGVPDGSPVSYEVFLGCIHPDDRTRVAELVGQSLAERRDIEYEYRVLRPDGVVRDVLGRNVVTSDGAGQFVGFAGTSLDITDRKRADQALVDSERYYRALIDQATDLTTLVDADGFIRYASPSNEPVLGYRPEELVGQRVFEFVHADDLAAALDVFTDGSSVPGAIRRLEFRFRHRDGSWRTLSAVGRNLFDDPVIKAGIINARDVTEQKRVEEHERTLLRELQRSVAEVKVLTGILPICASCKRIKKEDGGWQAVESYVRDHTDAEFSHGLCPDCAARDWGRVPG